MVLQLRCMSKILKYNIDDSEFPHGTTLRLLSTPVGLSRILVISRALEIYVALSIYRAYNSHCLTDMTFAENMRDAASLLRSLDDCR